MSGVQRQEIKNLQPNSQNSIVIGVIIGSLNPKNFEARNQKFGSGGMRAVWTFTLRDSPNDIINVTVWGGVEFINRVFNSYRIGSVVEVINGKVMTRQLDSTNEMFVPTATSPYTIVINEGVALIQSHDSPACTKYLSYLRMITKPMTQVKLLNNIMPIIDELQDTYVSLLVIVTFASQSQNVTSKDGRKLSYRIIEVRDGSSEEGIQLRLWEEEWIRMSEVWEPNRTALFIADARIGYDNYKKKNAISIVRKTIIIEDPDIPEVQTLQNKIRTKPASGSTDPFALPNPTMITNVMTIQEVTEKLNEKSLSADSDRLQLLTVIYAEITEINLDAEESSIISTKCALCKRIVQKDNDSCMNIDCPSGNGTMIPNNFVALNLKVHLKDETGYLVGCRLFGAAAENAIGHSAEEIQKMNKDQRSSLKWNFLLCSKFEVRIQILGPTTAFPRAIYNILSLTMSDSQTDFINAVTEK